MELKCEGCLAVAEMLVPAEMYLSPEEVRLAASEMLVPSLGGAPGGY